jgi:chromosome partitioning protein
MIILIGSEKGGVGKSTLATNIATFLATHNKDIILVDADRQGTSSDWFSERSETNLSKLECMNKFDNIKQSLFDLSKRYEYVVVDSQGRDSIELRTGLLAADICITPCRPSQADLNTILKMEKLVLTAQEINDNMRAFCVLTQSPTNPSITEIADAQECLAQLKGITLLKTIIHERKVYRDALGTGYGVIELSNEKASNEMNSLCQEILNGI